MIILLDGKFVAVTVKGSGRPVVFLHGYLSCKESFYHQINAVSQCGFKCIAPDLPAFGASAKLDSAWGVEEYADWLKRFLYSVGGVGADIIAHSFGARVAIYALSEDNGLCNKLVITGGAGLVKPRSPEYIRRVKRYRRIKKLFPKYAERHFGSEEYKGLSPLMKESYKKIVNRDLKAEAERINNPTLLIYGRDDCTTPPDEEGATFSKLMKNARLVTMQGDHFCFANYPEEFNCLAIEFLKE
ncbi:MAG: alpha/beta fold hydrolase [Candidatus Coproplasma sp.]